MPSLLGNLSTGFVIIVSAPAGTGKTTLVRMLLTEFPDVFVQSISCTTRLARKGEIEGKDYFFLEAAAFQKRLQRGDFLEHARVFDHDYGTLKVTVEEEQKRGKHVLLVIDTQGALALKGKIEAISIFIEPPCLSALEERLEKRETESEEGRKKRLRWAEHEIDRAIHYDYRIVNDDLSIAYRVLKSIIIAEEHKLKNNKWRGIWRRKN